METLPLCPSVHFAIKMDVFVDATIFHNTERLWIWSDLKSERLHFLCFVDCSGRSAAAYLYNDKATQISMRLHDL